MKKTFAVALCIVLAAFFYGCGHNESSQETTNPLRPAQRQIFRKFTAAVMPMAVRLTSTQTERFLSVWELSRTTTHIRGLTV